MSKLRKISEKKQGGDGLKTNTKTKTFGIYSVLEEWQPNGLWKGFTCSVVDSSGQKQGWGKLYPKSDGTENYKAKAKDDELEI